MIRYLLDTNTVSAVMKNDAHVLARLKAIPPDELGLPQPVIAEIVSGIERLPRSKRRDAFAAQLERVRTVIQRVAWTDDVSMRFGAIKAHLEKAGTIVEDFDVAIAAHALSIDAVLVTSNTKQMSRVPKLRIEDWLMP